MMQAFLSGLMITGGLIMAIGGTTKARANTIARTEVSRASTMFTQARAEAIGSDGYIWRSSEDSDVRDEHKELNGKLNIPT